MWLFTPRGFFSAVEDRNDPTMVYVRTRAREDADALRDWIVDTHGAAPDVVDSPHADYAYRLHLPKETWADFCSSEAEDVDYDNFKNAVTAVQGKERHDLYLRVWSAMLTLQPTESRFSGYYDRLLFDDGAPDDDPDDVGPCSEFEPLAGAEYGVFSGDVCVRCLYQQADHVTVDVDADEWGYPHGDAEPPVDESLPAVLEEVR